MKRFVLLLFIVASGAIYGQRDLTQLYLESGIVELENNIKGSETIVMNFQKSDALYRIVTFDELPSEQEKMDLKNLGVELLAYLPKMTFYAKITQSLNGEQMKKLGMNGIHLIDQNLKLSSALKNGDIPNYAIEGESYLLNISFFNGIESAQLESELVNCNSTLVKKHARYWTVKTSQKNLMDLAKIEELYYISCIPDKGEPENIGGRLDHRSNSISQDFNGGMMYNGDGVKVMLQDDGYIGEHIDYTGRVEQSYCVGCSANPGFEHGDHVAGTIMGAGNLDPMAKGMAYGAKIYVFGPDNFNYDTVPTLYNDSGIVITSKSYSNGCNSGYSELAAQLDQQSHNLQSLIHVFSAGNNGSSDCAYGAGPGWGNITGGHKSGKNVLTVGNLSQLDVIEPSSSKGPMTDGRIKPDICAVGKSVYSTVPNNMYDFKTGTSMSCPGVSGTVAQLYHAFKDLNGGVNPPAGLIKAAILNSAEDLGNPGPDFKYGYGRINARRAYEILENNNYIIDTANQGDNDIFFLNIPAGIKELKIMLYWADFEGTVGTAYALVNDLNLKVKDPVATLYEPWVLDHTPDAALLNADALRKVDSLNNMEQVTLLDPIPGTYEIDIFGDIIPQGPQPYYIVYQMVADEITVTHPNGGEGIKANNSCPIRWDSSPTTENFYIEYSTDNGSNWYPITTVGPEVRLTYWNTPSDSVTGQAKIRVSRAGVTDQSDTVFTLMKVANNLNIEWKCPDSLKFVWDSVPGATGYEISMLGDKYMDSIEVSATNSVVLMINENVDTWLSVRALGEDAARSERAIAIHKEPGQYACVWSDPVAQFDASCEKTGIYGCVTLNNTSMNIDTSSTVTWYFPGGTPSTSTDYSPTVCYDSNGNKDAALVVQNLVGTDSIYLTGYISVNPVAPIVFLEGFEFMDSLGVNNDWEILNYGGKGFKITDSASHTGSKCVVLENFGEGYGEVDGLISGPIDLSGLDENAGESATLSFRYAYKKLDGNETEVLKVLVRTACDENWAARKIISGNNLSSLISPGYYTPSSQSDWVTIHVVNITSGYWSNNFQMKFEFTSAGGNNLYLDDINIYEGIPSEELISIEELDGNNISEVSLYPNPSNGESVLKFYAQALTNAQIRIYDGTGRLISSYPLIVNQGENIVYLETQNLKAGAYRILLSTNPDEHQSNYIKY